MPYHYDVFISYSSNDKAWAEKLFAALEGRGLHPFLDKQRLEIGKPWERQLADALKNSQHLVVLWSNNAKQSDWVQRELALFDTINASSQVQQRLIFINLEGQNAAYAAWQMVDDLNAAKAYTNGIDKLDAHLWQEATKKVAQAIRSDDASIAIPAVILTMTRSDLDALQSSTWQTLQQDLGLTKEVLAQCYGDRRTDWHPFGSPDGVLQILEKLLDQINLA
jgi:hypothetical protein